MSSQSADTITELLRQTGAEFNAERIDDRYFAFRAIIFNDDGLAVRIRRGTIQELVLVDDLTEWHHRGHMIIQNPDEALERTTQQTLKTHIADMSSYRIRGDGRDYLYLEFAPLDGDQIESGDIVKNDVYAIRHMYTIHTIEDLPTTQFGDQDHRPENKTKKFTFHTYDYQLLLERNAFYSTGKFNKKNHDTILTSPLTQMSDKDRERHTGDILKDIISSTLPEVNTKFSTSFDKGITKLFYTSPAGTKAVDDINNILQSHLSATNERCILRQERTSNEWTLLPVSEYYKNALDGKDSAGPWLRERLTLGMQMTTGDKSDSSRESRTPQGGVTISSNLHFPDLSVVDQYLFFDTEALDTQGLLSTRPVHYKDTRTGKFKIAQAGNEILSVRDDFQSLYIDNLPGTGKGGPHNNIIVDDTRKENKNINVTHSNTSDDVRAQIPGKSNMMVDALFKGNMMTFTVKGDTTRKAGRFFSLDRSGPFIESDYDDKILGIYLTTVVVHRLTPFGYTNEITGIKPYSYKDMKFNESIR
jgi:hypothetical protein